MTATDDGRGTADGERRSPGPFRRPPAPFAALRAGCRPPLLDLLRRQLSPEQRLRLWQRSRRLLRPAWLGTLRRTSPLSDQWGFDRGTPVDRFYVERFLADCRADIHGCVLEVKDSGYTDRFASGVCQRDVLDVDPANPRATVVADLTAADAVPAESFDCFILTQTLQLIWDVPAALRHAHRLLRPGGVLLATVPTLSRIVPPHDVPVDYWRFTPDSCRRLFGDAFGPAQVSVRPYGNVLACIAFLSGLAYEELSRRELAVADPSFPLIVAVRAVKA